MEHRLFVLGPFKAKWSEMAVGSNAPPDNHLFLPTGTAVLFAAGAEEIGSWLSGDHGGEIGVQRAPTALHPFGKRCRLPVAT